jgi:two-component system nitrogen regulation sensor histidine kinase NtrY
VLAEAVAREPELHPLAAALERTAAPSGEAEDVDLVRGGQARRLRVVRVDLPDPDAGPAGTLILLEDVTDLMRSNQLAAWAEMARAIAHEIKNPLTPIQLSTEHLERLLRDRGVAASPEIDSCLQTVYKQVRALREIASEFSAYAKLPELAPLPTDPSEFLREVVAPYRAAHPPGVSIEEDYAPAGTTAVDTRVLSRAVVNLIENALQAMPQGGRLRVAVRREDGEVVLSVSDTGPGLDPKVRARLFTPYFSTKSSGTGLGLAIVRRAVEAHGGHIEVASTPGRGTTFTIHLPAI